MEFAATHNMEVKDQIDRLAKEYGRLKERWVFSPNRNLNGIYTGRELGRAVSL
jgi:hypothetical protein